MSLLVANKRYVAMDELMQIPELDDAQFTTEVMQLGVGKTERQHDRELLTKAHGLGIMATLPTVTVSESHGLVSTAMSDSSESISGEQAFSTKSDVSTMTYCTPHSSVYGASSPNLSPSDNNINTNTNTNTNTNRHAQKAKPGRKSLNFLPYDKYLAQIRLFPEETSSPSRNSLGMLESSGQSIFSVSTRRSLSSVRSGFRDRIRFKRKSPRMSETPMYVAHSLPWHRGEVMSMVFHPSHEIIQRKDEAKLTFSLNPPHPLPFSRSCSKCHAPLANAKVLQSLPCGHANCTHCLRDLTVEAMKDEATMPPRCCAKPVPADTLRKALDVDVQESFLKAILQYSTPSESRVFCCNPVCGEFIPPLKRVDTNMPSAVTCLKCRARVCPSCKRGAHALGTHCPEDWELLDALKIGGRGSWRRCYRCRNLVELTVAAGPVTCACKAQFCYACGGIWDTVAGCPNVCKGEEELARRRDEERRRIVDAEASEALEEDEAVKRSAQQPEMRRLLEAQEKEMHRMVRFREAALSSLTARQSAQEIALGSKHVEDRDELAEKCAAETSQLEDRQIDEELDLRSTLDQAARSIKIRIKHMEAYCHGLGKNPTASSLPPRVVTEQHLRSLGHQYSLRDDVERQHQAKINIMRDRQSKRMEELLQKHELQLDALSERNDKAYAALSQDLLRERETFETVFEARQSRLTARWALAIQVLCKQLEERDGLRYSVVPPPSWPEPPATTEASAS
ncbi:hypothetical protein E4U42_007166 [Claviceps africana]|uniref:IBR domain-containing protein n=1 Tax=Claviceps africana TaxID=83212 RepID=A0A8K0J227_9HYPO|nr:hypothetical protein E4U42_007166 [Claviceps africana]